MSVQVSFLLAMLNACMNSSFINSSTAIGLSYHTVFNNYRGLIILLTLSM